MSNDKRMVKKTVWLSHSDARIIDDASARLGLPISRIVGLLVADGLLANPKIEYDFELPSDYVEYAFAAEAGRILDYMKKNLQGCGLDMLYILRKDMGIEDKEILLGAFKELIEKGYVEKVKPPVYKHFKHNEDYEYFSVQQSKKDKRYQKYLKMKQEFEKDKSV